MNQLFNHYSIIQSIDPSTKKSFSSFASSSRTSREIFAKTDSATNAVLTSFVLFFCFSFIISFASLRKICPLVHLLLHLLHLLFGIPHGRARRRLIDPPLERAGLGLLRDEVIVEEENGEADGDEEGALLVLGKPSLVEGVATETAGAAQKPVVSGGRGELAAGDAADRKRRRRGKRRRHRRLKDAPRRREDTVGASATEEPARRRRHHHHRHPRRSGRHISGSRDTPGGV